MSRILHDTIMRKVPDPTTDEVGIKTMLQCDRGIRIFTGIYNAEFEIFGVFYIFSNGEGAEYRSMLID